MSKEYSNQDSQEKVWKRPCVNSSGSWAFGLSRKVKQRILGKKKTQLDVSEQSNSQGNRKGRLEGVAGRRCQGEMEAVSSFLLGLPSQTLNLGPLNK